MRDLASCLAAAFLSCSAGASVALAQPAAGACRVDYDCGGDQVCTGGRCAALPAAGAPAAGPRACQTDRDCPGDDVCDGARCVAPRGAPGAPAAPATAGAAVGGRCLGNHECAEGLTCVAFTCIAREAPPPQGRTLFGVFYRFAKGVGGPNASPGGDSSVGFELDFASPYDAGKHVWIGYHLAASYQTIGSGGSGGPFGLTGGPFGTELGSTYNGGRIEPLGMSFGYRLFTEPVRFEVGLVANAVSTTVGVISSPSTKDSVAVSLSSGASFHAMVGYKIGYLLFSPIGFEGSWFSLNQHGAGWNYPIKLVLGLEFDRDPS